MKKEKNSIIKSLPYTITKFLGYLISMVSLPILTNMLTKTNFGNISTIEAKMNLLVSIFLIGIPQSYIRYYNKYIKLNKKEIFNSSFIYLNVIIWMATILFSFIALNIGNDESYSTISVSILIAFLVVMQNFSSIIRVKEKTTLHALLLGINDTLGYILPIVGLIIFGPYINSYFISKIFVPIILLFFILFNIKNEIKLVGVDYTIIKELIIFGLPLVMVAVGSTLLSAGDRIIIDYILGPEQVAIYSVASKISHAIQQLIIFPITMVLFPMYIRVWENDGKEQTESIVSKWFSFYSFISFLIIFGSFSIKDETMILLSNSSYKDGALLIPILTTGLLIYSAYYFISAGFFVANKTLSLAKIVFITSILNLVLNFILGKYFGLIGTAVATTIAYIIFMCTTYLKGSKILKININIKELLIYFISGLIMAIILQCIPKTSVNLFNIFIKIAIGTIIYTIINYKTILRYLGLGEKKNE